MSDARTRIALFTRDLRVADNPVLTAAAAADQIIPLFVRDPRIADARFSNPSRQQFLDAGLADLDRSLRQLGSALLIVRGDPVQETIRLAERFDVESVHIAADVSGYAQRREDRLRDALEKHRRRLVVHDAVITVQPAGTITPQARDHFAVFTPYYRRWSQTPRRSAAAIPERLSSPPDLDPAPVPTRQPVCGWEAGEVPARRRADAWLADGMDHYQDLHDLLDADGTSRLSPYLHFGFVSAAELADRASRQSTNGAAAFVRQLAWRDFHHQVLAARPRTAWQDYRTHDDRWRDDGPAWQAWQAGQTGYPIVDAGMRQLAATGWMHNRARLIVGSFLTKTLYLDWRLGAQHFLDHLLDGDIANNNLNWQWVAGTGTDTRPNRVLNPLRQAERFDPDGHYVRRWVPELADVEDSSFVHEPWRLPAAQRRSLRYPDPIVDLTAARDRFRSQRS